MSGTPVEVPVPRKWAVKEEGITKRLSVLFSGVNG